MRERVPPPHSEGATEPLLTTAEVARLLRIHPKTVLRYVKTSGLPCTRLGGRLRFMSAQVLRWLEQRKEPT
jgi:excisionase family DNA binding protein